LRYYSTKSTPRLINNNEEIENNPNGLENNEKLDPWFLTGFSDAEGHFSLNVRKIPLQL